MQMPGPTLENEVLAEIDRRILDPETTLADSHAALDVRSDESVALADQLREVEQQIERKEGQRLQLRHALRSGLLTTDEAGDELDELRAHRNRLTQTTETAQREHRELVTIVDTLTEMRDRWQRARDEHDQSTLREMIVTLVARIDATQTEDETHAHIVLRFEKPIRPDLSVVFGAQASPKRAVPLHSNQSK